MDKYQEEFEKRVRHYRDKFIDSPLGNNELFEKILHGIVECERIPNAKLYEIQALIAAKKSFKAN